MEKDAVDKPSSKLSPDLICSDSTAAATGPAPTAKKLRPPYESRRSRKALVRQLVHDWPRIQWIRSLCRAEGPPQWAFRNHSSRSAARLHCRDCLTSTNIKGRGVHPIDSSTASQVSTSHSMVDIFVTAEYKIQDAAETRDAAFPRRKINTEVCR